MSTTQDLHHHAASVLAAALPTQQPLEAVPVPGASVPAAAAAAAVTGSHVGAVSADLALALPTAGPVATLAGTDSALVSTADVLRPALEAAAAALGPGVLGDTRVQDAADLFRHSAAAVYELRAPGGQAEGWFAVRNREGAQAAPAADASVVGKLGRISNVDMSLTVEIGRTRMAVRDVLALEPGRIVELDRSAGAPADILLNGKLIANGEIVVLDQDYAVRITKILDVAEGLA